MMSTACFENPLFDRTFLITSKRPSSVCVSLGAVLSYEGDSGGYLDEVTRLAELLTTVTEVVTNSEQATNAINRTKALSWRRLARTRGSKLKGGKA